MAKLSEPLIPEQIELLKIIWEPIPPPLSLVYPPGWPVWDYVSRRIHRSFPAAVRREGCAPIFAYRACVHPRQSGLRAGVDKPPLLGPAVDG